MALASRLTSAALLLLLAPLLLLAQPPPPPPPTAQLAMAPPPAPPLRLVPGSRPDGPGVTSISLPFEDFNAGGNRNLSLESSYVIEQRRYYEAFPTRCLTSVLGNDDVRKLEPHFVVVTKQSELRVNATAAPELLLRAGYQPNRHTTIIVHGFTQSYPDAAWLRKTRALFELNSLVGQQNILIMDWSFAARGPYQQAAAYTSIMGSYLAHFIDKLLELGQDRLQLHLVGHSLGAHVAGFAGKRIRPRLGRITGLDAAGPCFGKVFLNDPRDRLQPDDAFEVADYHFDDDFLGLPGQHGQFDVYVNGGSQQPGCKGNAQAMVGAAITLILGLNRVLSESHTRSTEVFTAQLASTQCQQVAYECRDYATFVRGECGHCDDHNNQCYLANLDHQYHEPPETRLRQAHPSKRLYVSTGPTEDLFCMLHYQILVKFEPQPELSQLAKRHKWRLQLELRNERRERLNVTLTNQMAPNVFSYLLLTDARPSRFQSAQLLIQQHDGKQVRLQQRPSQQQQQQLAQQRVFAIDVNFMSHIDPQVRRALSSRLCPVPWTAPGPQSSERNEALDDGWSHFSECFAPPPPPPPPPA